MTLMEVLLVVVILGILASIGLISYSRLVNRHHWTQARETLLAIYAGERAYYAATGVYLALVCNANSCDPGTWQTIHTDTPMMNSIPVEYRVVLLPPPPARFVATATHTTDGLSMTINEQKALCADPVIDNCAGRWPRP